MTQLNYTYILNLLRTAHLIQLLIVPALVWPDSQIDRGLVSGCPWTIGRTVLSTSSLLCHESFELYIYSESTNQGASYTTLNMDDFSWA